MCVCVCDTQPHQVIVTQELLGMWRRFHCFVLTDLSSDDAEWTGNVNQSKMRTETRRAVKYSAVKWRISGFLVSRVKKPSSFIRHKF